MTVAPLESPPNGDAAPRPQPPRSKAPATTPDVLVTPCEPWPRPYYLEGGLRRVAPYHYTYNTYCKERWRDKEVLSIFESEFRDRPLEYYKKAIESGNVVINGKRVPSVDTLVRNGDVISHTLHRHEPPVTASPIGVAYEDADMIVIDKPAGVPVHPSGRYNYNSVIEIMRAERGYTFNPLPCNRLDRLTSGIMFVGKNKEAAGRLSVQLRDRAVRKEYVARVVGEFPEGDVVCERPILQISPKLGLNRVRANGKEAKTVFRRLAYYPPLPAAGDDARRPEAAPCETAPTEADTGNGIRGMSWKHLRGYSIVRCMPLTGRTHQLRVHLQYLGHPIANDPIYANQRVFGHTLGKGNDGADDATNDDEDVISRLSRMGKTEVAEAVAYHDELVDAYHRRMAERWTGKTCEVCETPLYSDPGEHELGIYLHAKKYAHKDGQWSYETKLPEWAMPPPGREGPRDTDEETDPLAADLEKLGLKDEADPS